MVFTCWIKFSLNWSILLNPLLVNSQVSVQPTASIVIPVGESRTITCTLNTGISFIGWSINFMNAEAVSIENDNSPLPGVTTASQSQISILTLNTSNTGITSIACIGIQTAQVMIFEQRINVTIFGAPDPPTEIALQLASNRLEVSWNYRIIESVTVTFNLSLTFLNLSALEDDTTEVTDTRNTAFTLLGNRSCDPFRFCIAGRNSVGQGENSCTVGSLPYVPPLDKIQYSLSKRNGKFVLSVTVIMPDECQSSEARYILLVRSLCSNDSRSSQQVPVGRMSIIEIGNLSDCSSHKFIVVSMNAIGEGRSKETFFCKFRAVTIDVQGVEICTEDNLFQIRCMFLSGSTVNGCHYLLVGLSSNITGYIPRIDYEGAQVEVSNTTYYKTIVVSDAANLFDISNTSVTKSLQNLSQCTYTNDITTVPITTTEGIRMTKPPRNHFMKLGGHYFWLNCIVSVYFTLYTILH